MWWWLRAEGRIFGVVFVVFNVLLALFNIFNYRIASRATVPCVVIVAPTPPPPPEVQRFATAATVQAPQAWTDTPSIQDASSTPHTKRLLHNASEEVTTGQVSFLSNGSKWEVEKRDKYTVVKQYIPAEGPQPGFNSSVTLSTQGTYEFLQHVPELCERWKGPISVSVYAPGTDLPVALRKILFLRQCKHPCVRLNVTWHMVFDTSMAPPVLESPEEMAELESYVPFNCSAGTAPLNLLSEIRNSKKMPYPINVARNVARQEARTHYVLASDIELYPSINIIPRFLKLAAKVVAEAKPGQKRVFTLPIFEIKKDFQAPRTKTELVKRIKDGHAIFFHKWVCDACQNFPKRDEWLKTIPKDDGLNVFHVTKRRVPRTAWEPIYIGTNAEPLYDERLTWEGKRDKMSQMYELCLLDYDFYILDNAFLVHAPGIKTLSSQDQKRRAPFMYKNNALHNKLLAAMKKKYGPRKGC